MSNLRLNKIKSQTPISIIVHGGNRMGQLIAKALIEQGSYVVIIDKFNSQTRKYITDLKKSELVDFFDFKGYESLLKNIKRFDYAYYFLNEKLTDNEFDSKEFLSETKYLEQTLIATKKNKAKFSLITSLSLNRELANRVNNIELSKPSPYSNVELQKYCETMVAEFSDRTKSNLRIIRLGTLIGKGIEKIDSEVVDNLFQDATQKAQITIKGEGLDIHNLIHESDAIFGILKLTFLDSTKGEVITLANKNNYTTLSLAYKLLELNTDAQSIRFVDNPDEKYLVNDIYVPAPHASKYGWTQQISLEEAIIEQIQTYYDRINKSWDISTEPVKKYKPSIKVSKTKFGRFIEDLIYPIKRLFSKKTWEKFNTGKFLKTCGIGIVIIAFSYFILYPIFGTLVGFTIITTSTKQLSTSFLDTNIEDNNKNIKKIGNNIDRISESISRLYWLFDITNNKDLYNNISELIMVGQNTVDGSEDLLESISPLVEYIQEFEPALSFQTGATQTTREYREYLEEMSESTYKLDEAEYKLSLASEMLQGIDTTVFPDFLEDDIKTLTTTLSEISSGATLYKEAVSFLPELLGEEGRMRYLVLLQNEGEIRSTGGWLTSYGIIGIEGGQIRELYVDDIYNADGTLKVQGITYTPPDSMAKALDIDTWSFSLVNWYPELSETLSLSNQFTEDLDIGDIDGVITIDVTFLQKLLDKWGGIEVPGESEIITSDNLYSKIFEMHTDFVPGSTQKTTFLADLANEIVQKILSMNITDMLGLKDVFEESLEEKHLQATFTNSQAYNFFNSRNWAGSLDNKYNDAPIIIDWNWGGNKANLYLDKTNSLTVDIKDENTIEFTYILTVKNESQTNTYPEGDYINYERIYLPSSAKILDIEGMKEDSYDIYKENGFKVIGGWFNTEILDSSTLTVVYRLNREESKTSFPLQMEDNTIFLDLNIFKQAGESKSAYKLDIAYPSTWSLKSANNLTNASTISSQITSRFELNKDTEFNFVWEIPN